MSTAIASTPCSVVLARPGWSLWPSGLVEYPAWQSLDERWDMLDTLSRLGLELLSVDEFFEVRGTTNYRMAAPKKILRIVGV